MLTNCVWRIFRKTASAIDPRGARRRDESRRVVSRLADEQASVRVCPHQLAVEDERRRVELLHDQRAEEHDVPAELLAPVDRTLHPAEILEVDGPGGCGGGLGELGEL